jgi:hypothetical protein
MNDSQTNKPVLKNPTPEELVGITICKEEGDSTIQLRALPNAGVNGMGGKSGVSPNLKLANPTADDLAGIPITVEGEEFGRARPRNLNQ